MLFSRKINWDHDIFLSFKTHGMNSASRKSVIIQVYTCTERKYLYTLLTCVQIKCIQQMGDRRDCDCMVVAFIATYIISTYRH